MNNLTNSQKNTAPIGQAAMDTPSGTARLFDLYPQDFASLARIRERLELPSDAARGQAGNPRVGKTACRSPTSGRKRTFIDGPGGSIIGGDGSYR